MANPSQYVVDPNTGETLVVAEGETDAGKVATYLERAQKQGFRPATQEQIAQYDKERAAYRQVAESPVTERVKTAASALGRGAAFLLDVPALAATVPEALAGAAEKIGTTIRPDLAEAYRRQTQAVAEQFAPAKKLYREITPTALEQSVLGVSPEVQRAREETYPGMAMAGTIASFIGPQVIEKVGEKVLVKGAEKAAAKVLAAKAAESVADKALTDAAETSVGVAAARSQAQLAKEASTAASLAKDRAIAAVDEALTEDARYAAHESAYQSLVQSSSLEQAAAKADVAATDAEIRAANLRAQALQDAANATESATVDPAIREAAAAAQKAQLATQKAIAEQIAVKNSPAAKALRFAEKYGVSTQGISRAIAAPVEQAIEKGVTTALRPGVAVGEALARPVAESLAESSTKALVDAAPAIQRLPKVTQEIVAKAAAQGAGSVIDMGLFQLGQGVHEDILGNHDLTAERVWAHMSEGALTNAVLGAGLSVVPSVLRGALSGTGTAVKATRDVLVSKYPQLLERLGGTAAEAEMLLANREALRTGKVSVADLIEADLAKREPLPVAPERPIKPLKALTAQEAEDLARDFVPALQQERGAADKLLDEMKKTVLPGQAAKAIEAEYAARALPAQQAYLESIGGVAKTPEQIAELNAIAEGTLAPARQVARDLSGAIAEAQLEKLSQASIAIPQTTFKKMLEVGQELVRLSETAGSASEIQRGLARLKDEIWQLRPKASAKALASLPNADRTAVSVINDVWGQLKAASESPQLWGEIAPKVERWNDAAKQFYARRQNWLKTAGREITLPGGKKFIEYDRKKVKSLLGKMHLMDTEDAWQSYLDYRKSIRDLQEASEAIAEGYAKNYGSESLSKALADADSTYVRATENSVKRSNVAAELEAYPARMAEFEKQDAAFNELLNARKAMVQQRATVLGDLGKSGALVDHLETAGVVGTIGTSLMHLSSPYLAAASLALKSGRIVANPVKTMKTLAWLEKGGQITDKALRSSAEIATGVAKGAVALSKPIRASMNMKQERELYEHRMAKLVPLMTDPETLTADADSTISEIKNDAPKIAAQAKDAKVRAAATMIAAMPQPPPSTSVYGRMNWKATDAQVRDFNRAWDTVSHPTGTLARVADGTVTKPEIDIVKTVYPALTEHYKDLLLENLRKNPNVSAARRQMLRQFFGIDVDGAIQHGVAAQGVYQQQYQPQQQRGQQMPVSRAQGLGTAGRAGAETEAWRQAQDRGLVARIRGQGRR